MTSYVERLEHDTERLKTALGFKQLNLSSNTTSDHTKAILDLQSEVGELLRYKEECFNTKAEVSVLRDRLREKELDSREVRGQVKNLLEENDTAYEKMCEKSVRLEREVEQLRAFIAAMKTDAAKQCETNSRLHGQILNFQKKNQKLNADISVLTGQKQALKTTLNELEYSHKKNSTSVDDLAVKYSSELREIRAELESKHRLITTQSEEFSALRSHSNKQTSIITELNISVSSLTDRLEQLISENSDLPRLRTASNDLIKATLEADNLRKENSRIKLELDSEKTARSNSEAEVYQLKIITQQHRDRIQETHGVEREECERMRTQLHRIEKELQHATEREEKLTTHLHTVTRQAESTVSDEVARKTNAAASLENCVRLLTIVLENTLKGEPPALPHPSPVRHSSLDVCFSPVAEVLNETKRKVFTICCEVQKLRGQLESVLSANDTQEKKTAQLQQDHLAVVKEHHKTTQDNENLVKALREAKELTNIAEDKLVSAHADQTSKEASLEKLVRSSKMFATVHINDTPLSFDTLLFMLNDALTAAAQLVETKEARLTELEQESSRLEVNLYKTEVEKTQLGQELSRKNVQLGDAKHIEAKRAETEARLNKAEQEKTDLEQILARNTMQLGDLETRLHKAEAAKAEAEEANIRLAQDFSLKRGHEEANLYKLTTERAQLEQDVEAIKTKLLRSEAEASRRTAQLETKLFKTETENASLSQKHTQQQHTMDTIKNLSCFSHTVLYKTVELLLERNAMSRYCRELYQAVQIYEGGPKRAGRYSLRAAVFGVIAARRLRNIHNLSRVPKNHHMLLPLLNTIKMTKCKVTMENLPSLPTTHDAKCISDFITQIVDTLEPQTSIQIGYSIPRGVSPVVLAEKTLLKNHAALSGRDSFVQRIEGKVREIEGGVITRSPPPKNISPKRTNMFPLDSTPTRVVDSSNPVLAFISRLDQRVEETLQRSRALNLTASNITSVDSDGSLLNPVIMTEPPSPL
eukprot:TRINITY_DN21856_c0_g1_i1.p1 TRINITY_DN21856_c0_g1~~TRINITY_DN21856_c0_g1_i1.p1  ORF type:complete len:1012 (+),score=173.09 TRINITY_DN21856_c0_g1_i1:74-3037(+)